MNDTLPELSPADVRAALLAADVHFKVAREFVDRVQLQCVGQEVLKVFIGGRPGAG